MLGPQRMCQIYLLVRFHNHLSSWLTLFVHWKGEGEYIFLVSLCLWSFYSMSYSQIEFCSLYLVGYLHLKRKSSDKPPLCKGKRILNIQCMLSALVIYPRICIKVYLLRVIFDLQGILYCRKSLFVYVCIYIFIEYMCIDYTYEYVCTEYTYIFLDTKFISCSYLKIRG